MAAASSTLILMMLTFSLALLSSNSGEQMLPRDEHGDHEQQMKKQFKVALGSSPPRCVNRCMSCRPCTATLVLPPHHKMSNNLKAKPHHYEGDETYYLLSWKCRCRNKLFQP